MADFNNNNNKAILWELLIEQKLFEGIDMKYRYEIKDAFEQTILLVEKQGRGLSLIEKNKDVIKNMVIILDTFKRQQVQHNNTSQYNNEDLKKERQKAFERELKRKQTEFDGLNRTIPEKIDFSDKSDEKIGDKMDMLLAETIASRERQLKQVLEIQNPESASKWIENGNDNTNTITNIDTHGQIISNLKIGSETTIQETQIVNLDKKNQKNKVSFDDNNKILNFSFDSAPNTINDRYKNNDNQTTNELNIGNFNNNDIGINFLKMLKKEDSVTVSSNSSNTISLTKNEVEIMNNNNIENNIRLDIDNLKKELTETNKSINEMNKAIHLINSKQEEIIFILKTMMNLQKD